MTIAQTKEKEPFPSALFVEGKLLPKFEEKGYTYHDFNVDTTNHQLPVSHSQASMTHIPEPWDGS